MRKMRSGCEYGITTRHQAKVLAKRRALKFDSLIASGHIRDAFEKYVSPTFRHHNPYFKGDRESLLLGLERNAGQFADKIYEVQRVLEDGELVAIHSDSNQSLSGPKWP